MVIGAEYVHLSKEVFGKKKPVDISDQLTEEEKRYIYQNPEGDYIFTPIYEIYNETFIRELIAKTKIKATFTQFQETSWFEKYRLNTYQFSAAKDAATCRMMQAQVYDPNGKLRSWPQFRNEADKIQETTNKVWLRVERDNAARQAIMADKFTDFRADADVYPYWIYKGRLDSKERPEHRSLEGLIFRIGDPYGDSMFPPGDWNCRCTGKQVDDLFLRNGNRKVQTNEEAKGWLHGDDDGKPFVDEQFRYNPADQGMMPKQGTYFEGGLSDANAANAKTFTGMEGGHQDLEGLASRRFTYLLNIVQDWKQEYHLDRYGNIIFQNKNLLSNVSFTNHSIHAMHKHPTGTELLPKTIQDPAEVWMRWEDREKQQVVLRNYITFGNQTGYVVQTRDGAVQDAFIISRRQLEKFRTGLPWIKH